MGNMECILLIIALGVIAILALVKDKPSRSYPYKKLYEDECKKTMKLQAIIDMKEDRIL